MLGQVGLQTDGDDGVDAGEYDEGYFKVLGESFVLHVSFLVVVGQGDGVFAYGV